jgi:hypothetical protein
MSLRSIIVAACICAMLPTVSFAETAFGFKLDADSKTTFIWTGAKKNPGKDLCILAEKETNSVGSCGSIEIDLLFDKADLNAIKWCSYIAKAGERFNYDACKPDKKLKPGGKITIK